MYIYETADEIDYETAESECYQEQTVRYTSRKSTLVIPKGKQSGYKFRRQHFIKQYIVDFINLKYKLIVEIDGKYHLMMNRL